MEIFSDNIALAIRRLRKMNDLENRVEERTEELQGAYEELKKANKLKDQVMGMATHELRTPLTSIKGYVDYIRSGGAGKVPEEIDELLKIVERNSKRLQKLTDDMLDQQRLETGTLEMEMEYTDVVELIEEAKEEIKPVLREKGQKLSLDIENTPKCKLEPTRISQVLINLLTNASKYSPRETEIKLKVKENSDKVIIKVIDEGIGLCDEDLDKLFKPFPHIEKPAEYTNGIGLGLTISRDFVELHGGEMWAESQGVGRGSTFIFTLPVPYHTENDA
ncbi:hypothetical protein GF319_15150 [Candidatus Bathyarchaeota archaeon]|nr:hypothetical protein [Candidatus Bathyarchaeota archaeon]